jgi:copper transport protein
VRCYPRVLVFIFFIITILWGSTISAGAHAFITASNPNDGEILKTLPSEIKLTFNEEITASKESFTLLNPDGAKINLKSFVNLNNVRIIPTYKNKVRGSYLLTYSIISKDGHLISGTLPFSLDKVSGYGGKNKSLTQRLVKYNEVALWVIIIFLASLSLLNRSKKARIVSFIIGLILLTFNLKVLVNDIGKHFYLYNPGRYLITILISLIFSFLTYKRVTFYLSVFFFALLALFSGHSLDLPGTQSYAKIFILAHLVAVFIWISAVIRLRLEPTVKQLSESRRESTYAIYILLFSGSAGLIFILINSHLSFNNFWVRILAIKLIIFFLIALLGLYHHTLSKKSSFVTDSGFKRSINIEILFFLIIMGLSGGLSANPAPIKNHNVAITQNQISGYINFDNALKVKYTLEGLSDKKMMMLYFDKDLNSTIKKIDIYASNDKLGIRDIKGELSGSGSHFMGSILLPYHGDWSLLLEYYEDEFTIVKGKENLQL